MGSNSNSRWRRTAKRRRKCISSFRATSCSNLAENCTHNFHNLLPFRGADVRDALAWSKYLGEALQMWGGKADAMCGQHHWPVWGAERIDTMIRQQRDLYKFAHDQTIRLMNHGLTATEIAETIRLPKSLDGAWHARGYYGHIRHNVKAIYQKYLGWYDANPVNLDPLPPVEAGKKYVEYMGGAEAILARAAKDFAKGEFRFVAQAVSHLVFAEPDNRAARALLADTFEQLGYAAESSTWRNAYLFGAQELRQGMPKAPPRAAMPRETLAALRTEQLWDVLGVRLNGPKAEGKRIVLNWNFTDTDESFVLNLENCALTYVAGAQAADADAGFTLARGTLDEVIAKLTTFPEAVAAGKIKVTRQPDAARRTDGADGRIPADVRDRRTEADGGELDRCRDARPRPSRPRFAAPQDGPNADFHPAACYFCTSDKCINGRAGTPRSGASRLIDPAVSAIPRCSPA